MNFINLASVVLAGVALPIKFIVLFVSFLMMFIVYVYCLLFFLIFNLRIHVFLR